MIVEISGTIGEKRTGWVVIRTSSGLGYGLDVPRETEEKLPGTGEAVRLFTHLMVREDQWRLIGFATEAERDVFLDLLEVNGVGVRGALSLMSHLGIGRLRDAVLTGDWKSLKGAPGVGAKIAQRVQLELMSRWAKSADQSPVLVPDPRPTSAEGEDEVVLALVNLGYRPEEAQLALQQVQADDEATRLRLALKALDRGRAR
ncbi:Holliday junction branch migration protein RuvA [Sulfobacillus harzensis]|uniref:Holliday junction branch migration complex subunit RuvA n=1 Tax=Sulfobacillus harzensis TaxID=2729629 RepID=A0A7Y0L2Z7_9FIRM|nr:Holliday junction branch migration protein RuvA [Sulfobacillus harzensis]NMP22356.1 Holliday junction branch migration protein RuvA [Sulfobacillus harzensis]